MPYAANGKISQLPIDGGIEITDEQYRQALGGMLGGMAVSIDGGFALVQASEDVQHEDEPQQDGRVIVSSRDYLKRFTLAEYAAARTSSSIAVQWSLDNLIAAQYVDLSDPDVAAGLDAMVAAGIISEARKGELLSA